MRERKSPTPFPPPSVYDFGEDGFVGTTERFVRDLFGYTARYGLQSLAKRIHALEGGAGLGGGPSSNARTDTLLASTSSTADDQQSIARQLQGVMLIQLETTQRLNDLASVVEAARQECSAHLSKAESIRAAVLTHVEQLETAVGQFPDQWRADLTAMLDELRDTPDAANALLRGAESFAQSISGSLRD